MTIYTNPYEHMCDVAEPLFFARGYKAVHLRDIAAAFGVKHSALYYYAPQGKEQLYMQVMERGLERYHAGIEAAIDKSSASDDLRVQVIAAVSWLLDQEPLNIACIEADYPALTRENALLLEEYIARSLLDPFVFLLEDAVMRDEVPYFDHQVAAHSLVMVVEAMHVHPPRCLRLSKREVILWLADVIVSGWIVNSGEP